jgi:hypothetical protein
MTLRGIMLAAAFMASQPVDAAACHRYARWYYPWPQRCGAIREMRPQTIRRISPILEIPLPSLTSGDLVEPEADEPTRTRVLLRAALEAVNGH